MKQCAHCKEFKSLDEYAYSNKILKRRQKHCRACMSKFNKSYYKRLSDDQKERVKTGRAKRSKIAREYIWEYLSNHPCVECGERDPVVLEFDHIKGRKKESVSDMANGSYSLDKIKKEIAKCQVLCANCHRRKTSKELGWYRG